MVCSDFTALAQVQETYHIRYVEADFIVPLHLSPSEHFRRELACSERYVPVTHVPDTRRASRSPISIRCLVPSAFYRLVARPVQHRRSLHYGYDTSRASV